MIVMNYSSLSRFAMRHSLLVILLPLCLTACFDKSHNEEQHQSAESDSSKHHQQTQSTHQNEELVEEYMPDTDLNTVSIGDIKSAKSELNSLVSNSPCDTNSQCKVTPVGKRACGGPSSFVVYSTKTANETDILELSKVITSLESTYNAQNEMMSTCQHLAAPTTQCIENKCVKLEGSAVSAF